MRWLAGLVLSVLLAALPAIAGDLPPNTRVVVVHTPGPAWQAGVSFREQPGIDAHVAYYRQVLADGKLALGGPFLDDSGGMMISTPGASLADIEAIAQNDPAVKSGLLKATVRLWYPALHAP